MTPTNDQIVAEANRRATERGWDGPPVEHYIIEVTREGWVPDPDSVGFDEWAASDHDSTHRAAYRAGARMAREQEQERAKVLVEYVTRLVKGFFLYADYRERATQALAAYRDGKAAQ